MSSNGPIVVRTPLNGATVKQLHKCPKCDRTFPYIGHLKCHFYRVHPEFRLDSNELKILSSGSDDEDEPDKKEPSKTLVLSEAPSAFSTQFTLVHSESNEKSLLAESEEDLCDTPDETIEDMDSEEAIENKSNLSSSNTPSKDDIKKSLFNCNTCKKIFANQASYQKHCMTAHADIRYFMCSLCDKSFPTAARLKTHRKIHATKPTPCEECRKHPSKAPIRCTHQKNLFKCHTCSEKFPTLSLWKSHQEDFHSKTDNNGKGMKYHCEFCPKTFARKNTLDEHQKTHANEVYTCKVCNASFTDEKIFNEHGLTHKQTFKCSKCSETFTRKNHLIRHEQNHA